DGAPFARGPGRARDPSAPGPAPIARAVPAERAALVARAASIRGASVAHAASSRGAARAAVPPLDLDPVMPEREAAAEGDGAVRGAELAQRHDLAVQLCAVAVVENPADRVARRRRAQRAERPIADDRLRVDRLARAVDAALGEHCGRVGLPLPAPRTPHVE